MLSNTPTHTNMHTQCTYIYIQILNSRVYLSRCPPPEPFKLRRDWWNVCGETLRRSPTPDPHVCTHMNVTFIEGCILLSTGMIKRVVRWRLVPGASRKLEDVVLVRGRNDSMNWDFANSFLLDRVLRAARFVAGEFHFGRVSGHCMLLIAFPFCSVFYSAWDWK